MKKLGEFLILFAFISAFYCLIDYRIFNPEGPYQSDYRLSINITILMILNWIFIIGIVLIKYNKH